MFISPAIWVISLVPVPKCPFCLVKRDRRTIWEPRWARVADRDGDLYQLASTVSRIRLDPNAGKMVPRLALLKLLARSGAEQAAWSALVALLFAEKPLASFKVAFLIP